ncbi:MAG: S16 family serine protease [Candidatus Woesearchaeota archaeon]
MKKQLALMILCLLLLTGVASAKQGHLVLLAVHQEDGEQIGATADLNLEIKPGNGNVYLNTVPLTRIDTQISTRFAKDIACSYLDMDCRGYDFFYSIKADSSIVGGPSAGAATTALTVFLLNNMKYDEKIMVTGTINSGGIVGPIGGLEAKLQAASKVIGAKKVLIPMGERFIKEGNQTKDAAVYGQNLSLEVVEVATIDDVVYEFTGKHIKPKEQNLTIDPSYLDTMKNLATQLCNRTGMLANQAQEKTGLATRLGKPYIDNVKAGKNLTARGRVAINNSFYYSAASYCFGANVRYQEIIQRTLNGSELADAINETNESIKIFEKELVARQLNTITDLQAFMVASERLNEAKEQLGLAERQNNSKAEYLALAIERLQSSHAWSRFFGNSGKEYILNQEVLKGSCLAKIAEAEESYQYATLYLPNLLDSAATDISDAYKFLANKQYALCLSKASNAKANANSVLGVIGVQEDQVETLIDEKLDVGKQLIIKQAKDNSFPILGYSYWEYATSLKAYDKYSALLYSEYALELSNLDIYFQKKQMIKIEIDPTFYWVFALGLFSGILIGWRIKAGHRSGKSNRSRKVGKK